MEPIVIDIVVPAGIEIIDVFFALTLPLALVLLAKFTLSVVTG